MSLIWITVSSVFLILLLTAVEMNFFDAIKIVSVNIVDGLSIIAITTFIIYGIILKIYSQLFFYKFIVIICGVILFSMIILVRGFSFKKSIILAEKYKPNVLDLKEIFTGDFTIKEGETIILDEKDVDYDLLERGNVICQLYNAIQQCNPDGRFVISLEGKWGSGKTTIINNVKKRLKESDDSIVIIDEFDPWSYYDQKSLFFNMFDSILRKSGLKYSVLLTNQMAKSISESIFGSRNTGVLLQSLFKQPNEISALKNRINDYLKLCGKKVVFFIDNIDRAESDNIILLFKLVGNVLDFERVTYVLSFDSCRVNKIFEDNLSVDYQYLKKVIHMQIRVPEIGRNVFADFITTCIHNLLIAYGESKQNLKEYHSVISSICKQTNDLRDFKRFVNSVISIPFRQGRFLNKKDLLVIEYIRLYNPGLYEQIYKNCTYFISHDKIADIEVYGMHFNKKNFNTKAKGFFKTLYSSEENMSYINILAEIFPYVKKYKDNQDLESEGVCFTDGVYSDIAKNRRICSAKYFDLYFTNTENEFVFVGKLVEKFIDDINRATDLNIRNSIFITLLNSIHQSFHKEIFERLQLYTEDLPENAVFDVVKVLFDNIYRIDDTPAIIALDARKRVEVIIWELLQRITEDQFDLFLNHIEQEYGKIEVISSILYWFEHDKERKNIEGRKQKMEALYKEMGERIINNSINLYDDLYYSHTNIWGLIRLYKEETMKTKAYIKEIIDKNNIFRLLYDIIGVSIGTRIKYSISKTNLVCLTTEENIDRILKNVTPTSMDQQFVLSVYENYRSGITDKWGRSGIVADNVKKLNP